MVGKVHLSSVTELWEGTIYLRRLQQYRFNNRTDNYTDIFRIWLSSEYGYIPDMTTVFQTGLLFLAGAQL